MNLDRTFLQCWPEIPNSLLWLIGGNFYLLQIIVQLAGITSNKWLVYHILVQHLLFLHRTISNKFLKSKYIFTVQYFSPLYAQEFLKDWYFLYLYCIPDGVPTNQKACTGFHFLCMECWLNTWDNQILDFLMICRQEC